MVSGAWYLLRDEAFLDRFSREWFGPEHAGAEQPVGADGPYGASAWPFWWGVPEAVRKMGDWNRHRVVGIWGLCPVLVTDLPPYNVNPQHPKAPADRFYFTSVGDYVLWLGETVRLTRFFPYVRAGSAKRLALAKAAAGYGLRRMNDPYFMVSTSPRVRLRLGEPVHGVNYRFVIEDWEPTGWFLVRVETGERINVTDSAALPVLRHDLADFEDDDPWTFTIEVAGRD